MSELPRRGLVATERAVGSLRRMTLADGPEAGLDCIALSTGGGLDCWLLAGRSLDIGPLWWRGRQIGWMPPQGFLHPAFRRAEEEGGHGFARLFGGALVTCGLSHIRQPAKGEPLHGRLPFTPARVTLCRDRDGVLEVEGEVVEARLGGPVLVLRRRIEADVGGRRLRIIDEVENAGAVPAPFAVLYHFNFGWPLLAPGTTIALDDQMISLPYQPGDASARPCVECLPAGRGLALMRSPLGMTLQLRFDVAALPFLQIWHDLRPGICALALEPCSVPREAPMPILAQGEQRRALIELSVEDTG